MSPLDKTTPRKLNLLSAELVSRLAISRARRRKARGGKRGCDRIRKKRRWKLKKEWRDGEEDEEKEWETRNERKQGRERETGKKGECRT